MGDQTSDVRKARQRYNEEGIQSGHIQWAITTSTMLCVIQETSSQSGQNRRVGIDRQRCLESFGKGLDRLSLGWAVAGPSQTRRVGVGSTECRPDGQ